MCSTGFTPASDGRGGSFGYGKAGLIRASAIRTVIAYSCFGGLAEDNFVTRRLLGMTYGGPHEVDGKHHEGWAHYGSERGSRDEVVLAEDGEADELAAGLGLELRSAEYPECHQDGTSYGAVYGRMHGDRPAPTITTGFMTPGRGRFVHPTERRTLTAAEAARLQGFPDSYFFRPSPDTTPTRAQLAKWIGDAVAAPLGYAAALSALVPALAATAS
ncbi:MAG: DNA cytosine methyltransferase [Acidimicrobiaceae bacterium]|nr:DNA cytosine methyltransferase [Acidimicrobiaceae bacterium]